jgi:transcriptional regulator with XRE-family HTH domain
MSFRENLRKAREAAGFNIVNFTKALGLPYSTYISYENQGKEPRYKNLCKIALLLNTSPNELLGYDGDSKWRKKYEYAQYQLDTIREFLK